MEQNTTRLRKGGAVTVTVPGSAREYVDTFRRRYDSAMAHIVPHITLAFAAELDASVWMPARPRMREALARINPFTVRVVGVGTFMHDLVLWLRPSTPSGELLALRQTILEIFPNVAFDRVHDFVPHISIGFFSGQSILAEACAVIQRELIPFRFQVDAVSFLQADEGDVWHCVDTVRLGGDKASDSGT